MKLDGKVAVITGGSSGIGLAIAREFIAHGAKVAIFGRDEKKLNDAQNSLTGEVVALQGDVTNLGDIDRLFARVAKRLGDVDIVVANAGIPRGAPLADVTPELFDEVINTNLRGTFFTVQRGVAAMRDHGSVVLVTSVADVKGFPGTSVYAASKAAVRSLARTLAAELAPRGIRVNALSPGPIDTPIFAGLGFDEKGTEAMKQEYASQVPLGRMGRADEMAKAVLFLASADASFVTGAELAADGGLAQV